MCRKIIGVGNRTFFGVRQWTIFIIFFGGGAWLRAWYLRFSKLNFTESRSCVVVPPRVLLHGENEAQAVSMSGRVVLSCPVVAGDPPPEITWFQKDAPVQLSERVYQLPNGSLVIYDASVRNHVFRHTAWCRTSVRGRGTQAYNGGLGLCSQRGPEAEEPLIRGSYAYGEWKIGSCEEFLDNYYSLVASLCHLSLVKPLRGSLPDSP